MTSPSPAAPGPPSPGSRQPGAPTYQEHLPHPALRPWVECYWSAQAGSTPTTGLVLPDGCMDALFSLSGDAQDDGLSAGVSIAVGTMTHALHVPRHPGMHLWGVRFRPGAGAAFLGIHAAELTDRRLPLSDLWGMHADEVCERLTTSESEVGRTHCLDDLLRRRLALIENDLDARVLATFETISRGGAHRSVAQLAKAVGLGRRQLERCFSSAVGVPPKVACRIQRLRRGIAFLNQEAGAGLAEIALRAGYSDQAHFTREFRALTGTTPGAYRNAPRSPDVASVQDELPSSDYDGA